MGEWWTYRLEDFVLFAPATWSRLFERYHAALWPAQVPVLALGLALVLLAWRRRARPLALALAALGWLWVGLVFHGRWHTTINWAAPALAAAWALQGLLLAAAAAMPGAWAAQGGRHTAGAVLLLLAIAGAPLTYWLGGRTEIAGLTPDATALATLGLLLCTRPRSRWLVRALWPLALAAAALGLITISALAA
jgi:hypothetical protein